MQLPPLPPRLVEALCQQFPDRAPDLDWDEKTVWFKSGQVSVIRWLLAKLAEQEQEVI